MSLSEKIFVDEWRGGSIPLLKVDAVKQAVKELKEIVLRKGRRALPDIDEIFGKGLI